MARFLRYREEGLDRVFAGSAPDGDEALEDLASFLAETRAALARSPEEAVEARHVAALAAAGGSLAGRGEATAETERSAWAPAGRAAGAPRRRAPMRFRVVRWTVKVAPAAVGLVALTGGLARAGVDLPGTAAETAFQGVFGIELPSQGGEFETAVDPEQLPEDADETARGVLAVIQAWVSGGEEWTGCEFGARVAHAAQGLEGGPDTSHCVEEGLDTADEASGGAASAGAVTDSGFGTSGQGIAEEAAGGSERFRAHAAEGGQHHPTSGDRSACLPAPRPRHGCIPSQPQDPSSPRVASPG